MNRKDHIKLKIIITILLGCGAVFAYGYVLNKVQNSMVMNQVRAEMSQDVVKLMENYESADYQHTCINNSFDELYGENMSLLIQMMGDDPEAETLSGYLAGENEFFHFTDIMIADTEGEILASANRQYKDLKGEYYDPLREVFASEETVTAKIDPLSEHDVWSMLYDSNQEEAEKTDEQKKEESIRYSSFYACRIDEDTQLVLSVDRRNEMYCAVKSDPWKVLLQNEILGERGYVFVWSDDEEKILYYPDEAFRYQSVEKLGMNMDRIQDGIFVWMTIDGQEMYLYPVHEKEQGIWIACAVSKSELINSRRVTTLVQWILFALLAAALVYYVTLLHRQNKIKVLTDFTGSGNVYAHQSRQHKLFIITILVSLIMALFVFYLQTLYLMSTWAGASARQTQRIEETVKSNEETAMLFTQLYDSKKTSQIAAFSDFLSRNENLRTTNMLDQYSYLLHVSDIQVLGKDGKSTLSVSNMAYPAEFREAAVEESVQYSQMVALQDKDRKVCDWMSDGRKLIVPVTDPEKGVTGYLYVNYYSFDADMALSRLSLYGTLSMVRPGRNGFVFSVDMETKTFSYHPESEKNGRDSLSYGLSEDQIKENYCDYITVDNKQYYAITDLIGKDIIFFVVSKTELLRQRLPFTGIAVAAAFILFLLIGILLYLSRAQIEMTAPEEERRISRNEQKSAEYKVLHLLMYYGAAAAVVFSFYSSFRAESSVDSIFGYVLDGRWVPGFNVFALSASIIILSRGGVVLFIVSRLISMVGNILPVRGGTILKMVGGLGVYISVALLIYQCMLCFGLNPTALATSAGIVSVIVGIGANSLVGDILAGIFLLAEGNVQVGDVVQIGGFRGYVMELGVRMTKLFDMDTDDIKIIPNNEVKNVVHMTMRTAIVYSDFQIRYEEKLENVERILKEELEKFTDKSPLILEGPRYLGVSSLGESGVTLRVATKCHESCRKKVEREVNHIVYTIFQANNIIVPYPQVTVHQGVDSVVERQLPKKRK